MSNETLLTQHPARVVAGIAESSLRVFKSMGTPEELAAAAKLKAKLREWAAAEAGASAPEGGKVA